MASVSRPESSLKRGEMCNWSVCGVPVPQAFVGPAHGQIVTLDALVQRLLRPLEVGDIGVHGDDAAIVGASLSDLDPPTVGPMLQNRRTRVAMLGEALGDPRIDPVCGGLDPPALGRAADDRLETHSGRNVRAQVRIEDLAIAAVAHDQSILRVEQREALGDALDRIGEPRLHLTHRRLGALPLGRQPFALGLTVAEQLERVRHRADLVVALGRDGDVEIAAGDGLHRGDQPAERLRDRAYDDHGERDAEQAREDDDGGRRGTGRLGMEQRLLALRVGFRAHLCDQLAQPLIHGRNVLSRHRHQSVAGDAIAIRVGLDRLQRLRHQGIDLGSDLAHRARIVRFEQVELPLERRPRLRRLLLRPDQQAHGQIREPVLQIPERLVGAIRGFHQRQRFALLHERGGVLVQLAREIEARANQHAQQHHREQHKTREDRQPAHPACTSIVPVTAARLSGTG